MKWPDVFPSAVFVALSEYSLVTAKRIPVIETRAAMMNMMRVFLFILEEVAYWATNM